MFQLAVNVGRLVDQYQQWGVDALVFVGTLVLAHLLARNVLVPPVVAVIRRRNENNPTLVGAMEKYLRVLVVVVAVPVAMTAAGFGGVVAGSAVVVAALTLAVGVAGQDVIGNLVSGLFLVADPDFNVGDYVEWNDRSGTIAEIDLRVTRVRTVADEVVIVPNTELATTAVTAPYAGDRYRVTERLTVAYGEDTGDASDLLVGAAAADDRILDDPAPSVDVSDLGDSAVELTARFWVGDPGDTDVADVRSDFNARAKDRLLDAGVAVAPATQQELSGGIDVDVARESDGE